MTVCKQCGFPDHACGCGVEPAQQKPLIGETNVELGFYSNDASNGQQRELVGKMEMGQLVGNRSHESASNPDAKREIAVITGVDEYGPMLNWYTHWVNFPIGTMLYTSPPIEATPLASQRSVKPWVGLTEQERNDLEDYCEMIIGKPAFEAIEAKLREKNA